LLCAELCLLGKLTATNSTTEPIPPRDSFFDAQANHLTNKVYHIILLSSSPYCSLLPQKSRFLYFLVEDICKYMEALVIPLLSLLSWFSKNLAKFIRQIMQDVCRSISAGHIGNSLLRIALSPHIKSEIQFLSGTLFRPDPVQTAVSPPRLPPVLYFLSFQAVYCVSSAKSDSVLFYDSG